VSLDLDGSFFYYTVGEWYEVTKSKYHYNVTYDEQHGGMWYIPLNEFDEHFNTEQEVREIEINKVLNANR
jgi:hypothetical protein